MAFNPMKHRIPVLKRLVPSIRKKMWKLTSKNGFALVESHGALFLLNSTNYVDRQIAFYDDFEFEQTQYLYGRMRRYGCDVFLDVGANMGFYSVIVAKEHLAESIIAFEPDTRNRLQLCANIFLNGVANAITVVGKAVSDHDGILSFYAAPPSTTGQSRVSATEGNMMVECIRLDGLITEIGKRIAIKIDIEGHELAAIQGMRALISNNKVLLQVECFSNNIDAVTSLLTEMGMHPINKIGDDHYFTNSGWE